MAKILTIYCEGKRGSHDFDILEKVVGDMATIKPIGGKRGASAIIEFAEQGTAKSDFCCLFRDRDFDCPVPVKEELTFDRNKTYFSYRTTIENYLFDTTVFYDFLIENKLQEIYHLHSEIDVKNMFIDTARKIKNYQAVRHALGKLRFANSFDTTWTGGSGNLPISMMLDECRKEGWNVIEKNKNHVDIEWTKINFNKTIDDFISLFDVDFLNDLKFLVFFQGKDFAKALTNNLQNFPLKNYYKFAKEHFDYKKFVDLVQLRNILESKK
jgi:hypothetical protein